MGGLEFDVIVRHRHDSVFYVVAGFQLHIPIDAGTGYRAVVARRLPALAFALLVVIADFSAPPVRFTSADARCVDCRPQPVPCPPCFVCVQRGDDVGRVPQPECPLPRS